LRCDLDEDAPRTDQHDPEQRKLLQLDVPVAPVEKAGAKGAPVAILGKSLKEAELAIVTCESERKRLQVVDR
jgi:hypothetical protein